MNEDVIVKYMSEKTNETQRHIDGNGGGPYMKRSAPPRLCFYPESNSSNQGEPADAEKRK